MTIARPTALNQLVDRLIHTGRYADEGEVVQVLEDPEIDESPILPRLW